MRSNRPQPLNLVDKTMSQPVASSFLPSRGLFTPLPSSRATPNFCTTILEEDSDTEVDTPPTPLSSLLPSTKHNRQSNGMSVCPRMLRLNSLGDDSDSEDPTVLRFPTPPSSLPATVAPPARPAHRPPPLRNLSAPVTKPRLVSCFEDDSPSDFQFPRPLPVSAPIPIPTRSATAPLSLFKRATNVIANVKSPSKPLFSNNYKPVSPVPTSVVSLSVTVTTDSVSEFPKDKPLPRVPAVTAKENDGNVSPTPSLSSSISTRSDSSSLGTSGNLAPYPYTTSAKDVDDYVDALSAYFPPEVWNWDEVEVNRSSSRSRSRSSRRQGSTSSTASSHSRVASSEDGHAQGSKGLIRSSSSSSELRARAIKANASIRVGSPSASNLPLSASSAPSSSAFTSSSPPASFLALSPRASSNPHPSLQRNNSNTSNKSAREAPSSPSPMPKSILKSSKSTPSFGLGLATSQSPSTPQFRPMMVHHNSPTHSVVSHRPSGSTSSDSSSTSSSGSRHGKSLPSRPSIPVEMFIR